MKDAGQRQKAGDTGKINNNGIVGRRDYTPINYASELNITAANPRNGSG
jgi:hypothetical protein